MNDKILGTTMPVLELSLEQGESVLTEQGQMSWVTPNIQMQTSPMAGGGLGGFLKRAVGGGGFMMSSFTAQQGQGMVAFAAHLPGHIVPVDVAPGAGFLTHRHGYMCGTPGITLGVGFQQNLGAGFFGHAGFLLQKLEGQGRAWIELSGEMVTYDMEPGQQLLVHPYHLGLFQESISLKVVTVRGMMNRFMGGEGLFLLSITGPGKVWLQSMPLQQLALDIAEYLPPQQHN